MADRDSVEVAARAQWRSWLAAHHAVSPGVWLVTWKRAAGERHVPYEEIVLEALCFGWVDSRARSVDALRTSISMTPRRPGSRWTQPNRDRVAALTAAGRMAPAGLAAVAAAQASGAWDELRGVEALELPDDLAAALGPSRAAWESLTRSARYGHLLALHDSRRPETRARRLAAIVAGLR